MLSVLVHNTVIIDTYPFLSTGSQCLVPSLQTQLLRFSPFPWAFTSQILPRTFLTCQQCRTLAQTWTPLLLLFLLMLVFFFYSLVLGSAQMSERMTEHLLLFAKPKKEHGKGINCFKSPRWSGIIWCITENTWWRRLFSLFVFGWLWPRKARWIAQDKCSQSMARTGLYHIDSKVSAVWFCHAGLDCSNKQISIFSPRSVPTPFSLLCQVGIGEQVPLLGCMD